MVSWFAENHIPCVMVCYCLKLPAPPPSACPLPHTAWAVYGSIPGAPYNGNPVLYSQYTLTGIFPPLDTFLHFKII